MFYRNDLQDAHDTHEDHRNVLAQVVVERVLVRRKPVQNAANRSRIEEARRRTHHTLQHARVHLRPKKPKNKK